MFNPCFSVVLCVISSFTVISIGAGHFTLIAFLRHVTVSILCLFLAVPWVGLQCLIVAFPSHTHLLFSSKRRLTSFGW